MPRGTCENCGQHDAFLYATPLAFGRTTFICARCLNLPQEKCDEDEDEDEDANGCVGDAFSRPNATALINLRLRHAHSTLRGRKSKA